MRVTGGELGGRRLSTPRRGAELRPTSDRVREAIFSILGDVSGARVLDLFCGTGALGIEALSRGAANAVMVDTKPRAARRNIDELGLTERAKLVRADVLRFLRGADEAAFDLVLCDPPYRLADRLARELDPLIRHVLVPEGRAVVESSPQRPLRLEMPVMRERRYGDTWIGVYANLITTYAEEPE